MDPLTLLRSYLSVGLETDTNAFAPNNDIDRFIEHQKRLVGEYGTQRVSTDLQLEAVQRFWQSLRIDSLRDGRLVSFGMSLPNAPQGQSIIEDSGRFLALLKGVDQWLPEPKKYRRCYQGLMSNFFGYDAYAPSTPPIGKGNWVTLRSYLNENSKYITDAGTYPDWVTCILENRTLFGSAPCEPYAAAMLRGESHQVDNLRVRLGIDDSSWFVRELVIAQIKTATAKSDEEFIGLLPKLIQIIASNNVLRDSSMVFLLDRYARIPQTPLQQQLRDAAVEWWGNPWLTSNNMRWGGVSAPARAMVTEWLKLEFIEAFFTLLAEEGGADRRRMDFWKRYVHAIGNIQFALGSNARFSRSRDFVELRKKMKGLIVELKDSQGSNNAFIMTMGHLVAVEFSGATNAFYGYDARRDLPFDLSTPVVSRKDAPNSLKSSAKMLWMQHQDGIHGWRKWEQMFEATLKKNFDVVPMTEVEANATVRRATTATTATTSTSREPNNATPILSGEPIDTSLSLPYTRQNLDEFARTHRINVEDKTMVGGNLWVRASSDVRSINRTLINWGFQYRAGKGWWK